MDLAERLTAAAAQQGALAAAVEDIVRRGLTRFTAPPSDAELSDWMAATKVSVPFFFAQPVPATPSPAEIERQRLLDKLPPDERLTRARQGHDPVRKERPQPQSDAAVAAFVGLSVADFLKLHPTVRSTKARELEAQQGKH